MFKKGMEVVLEDGYLYVIKDIFNYNNKEYYYFEKKDDRTIVMGYYVDQIIIENDQEEIRKLVSFYIGQLSLK